MTDTMKESKKLRKRLKELHDEQIESEKRLKQVELKEALAEGKAFECIDCERITGQKRCGSCTNKYNRRQELVQYLNARLVDFEIDEEGLVTGLILELRNEYYRFYHGWEHDYDHAINDWADIEKIEPQPDPPPDPPSGYRNLFADVKCELCKYHSGGAAGGIFMALDLMIKHYDEKHGDHECCSHCGLHRQLPDGETVPTDWDNPQDLPDVHCGHSIEYGCDRRDMG